MSPTVYLITGANRGLGLGLVKQVLATDEHAIVIATVRALDRDDELAQMEQKQPGRIERLKMDMSDVGSVREAAEVCSHLCFAKQGIDVLIANAGISSGTFEGPLQPGAISHLAEDLHVNLVGTATVIDAFLPLLRRGEGKKVWVASSDLACLGGYMSEGFMAAPYSTSKTGLNMWTVKLARALEPEGFTLVMYHPGWVRTDMGTAAGKLEVDESVSQLLAVLQSKAPADSGAFVDYQNNTLPW